MSDIGYLDNSDGTVATSDKERVTVWRRKLNVFCKRKTLNNFPFLIRHYLKILKICKMIYFLCFFTKNVKIANSRHILKAIKACILEPLTAIFNNSLITGQV